MPAPEIKQWFEGRSDILVRFKEASFYVLGKRAGIEITENHRSCLGIERTAPVAKEVLHHPDLRAGEDIPGCLCVMLDLASDDGVDPRLGGEHILELVEDNEGAHTVTLIKPTWDREPVEQRRARWFSKIDLHADGYGSTPRA